MIFSFNDISGCFYGCFSLEKQTNKLFFINKKEEKEPTEKVLVFFISKKKVL